MKSIVSGLFGLLWICPIGTVLAKPDVLDSFDTTDAWIAAPSDGVLATIRSVDGRNGMALRLEYDFQAGAGFCVVRRELPMALPPNYRFAFAVRGDGLPNNFEFKLVDSTGENVWWVNRREFPFPREWSNLTQKSRQFKFAWGPSGGAPLGDIQAIEFAIAASGGGRGWVEIDDLTFETLPEATPATQLPNVMASSWRERDPNPPESLNLAGDYVWHSSEADLHPELLIDFQQSRELGGLVIEWATDDFATAYRIEASNDGSMWEAVASITESNGGKDYIPIPDAQASRLRILVQASSRGKGVGTKCLRVMGLEFSQDANAMFKVIAAETPRGRFPRYFVGEQEPWTVVGVPDNSREALLDAAGALEVDRKAFRIEPFLYVDGRLITWADVSIEQRLIDDYLPIPQVEWTTNRLGLKIIALDVFRAKKRQEFIVRYRVENRTEQPLHGSLFLAVRPFQVLPPWHELNLVGGVSSIKSISCEPGRLVANQERVIFPWMPPHGLGAASFWQGDITEYLAAGKLPVHTTAGDDLGLTSAALRYDFQLPGRESDHYTLTIPHQSRPDWDQSSILQIPLEPDPFVGLLDEAREEWSAMLNRVELELPAAASPLVDTFRTVQAHLLINADGPSIQPGSRTYERSWIRDGALSSTALLHTGHPERARAFLDWYGKYLYPGGKAPCVVDHRGPDPVPEHDSTGQYIYAVHKYYRFTRDREFLVRHFPRVITAVDYLEKLRNERMTDTYVNGTPVQRACYGLVPESISHEGYSAKPMHSYWDSFWVARGLRDASALAGVMERPDLEKRFSQLNLEYRDSLSNSIRRAMANTGADFIPGCVELGDFDATSTAIGLFPCEVQDALPQPALDNTFAKYLDFFRTRRDGPQNWDAYTPYEIRVAGAFLQLGQPEHSHELLDYFLKDRQPPGWNQWPEVVWRDPRTPKFIGDMPHTWVGAEFTNAIRSLFVYEREDDQSLVLAVGVRREWLGEAPFVNIRRFPTEYGVISYSLSVQGDRMVLELDGELEVPPGGLVFIVPDGRPIRSVTVDNMSTSPIPNNQVLLRSADSRVMIEFDTN